VKKLGDPSRRCILNMVVKRESARKAQLVDGGLSSTQFDCRLVFNVQTSLVYFGALALLMAAATSSFCANCMKNSLFLLPGLGLIFAPLRAAWVVYTRLLDVYRCWPHSARTSSLLQMRKNNRSPAFRTASDSAMIDIPKASYQSLTRSLLRSLHLPALAYDGPFWVFVYPATCSISTS